MKAKILLFAASFIATSAMAQGLKSGIDRNNMDFNVKPGENFYEYAAGNWLKSHPLDKEHPMNGAFVDLEELNKKRIREMVEDYAKKPQTKGTVAQKIASIYNLYMDSVRRNREGYTPIKPVLAKIRAAKNRKELIKLMYDLDVKGYGTFPVGFGMTVDAMNSDRYIIGISQGGIGLDPEYYTKPNDQQKAVIAAYKSLNNDLFKMTGNDAATAKKKMEAAFSIENQIAKVSYDQVKSRDPQANYHPMTWEQLLKNYPGVDWNYLLKASGYPNNGGKVDVGQPEPVHEVEKILATAPLDALKAYMELAVISSSAGMLSDNFSDRNFEYTKVAYGVQQQQPRWKRALSFVQGIMGEAVGKLYVQKYFPESSKQRMITLVKNLQDAFAQRIEENTWMTAATKKKAIEKLQAFDIKIGYPDKWQNMDSVFVIDDNKSLIENVKAVQEAAMKYRIAKRWGKPVDKKEWHMTPQTVNAYYDPTTNSINFPAAILQPPFFDPTVDDAANYGAIGAVIGHEMSHGFDDQGCQFDKDGNMKNWWTEEDKKNYDARTKVLVDWFNKQEVIPGLYVNGEKTLGENIGDNGGLNIAFRALENSMKAKPLSDMDGFTPAQRFFLAWGRVWASNVAPQFVAYIVNSDVHSPSISRVNAALPMIDNWYKAFDIKEGDKLFVPQQSRAHIW
ncbi:M13 family metallopeptidase [Prevotella melaninogenica]|uniref:M13 family metallopeptidase n=1 Tax=Prevotella melaninogenica TaxID=28132 RepID=UPI001C5FD7C6|nr:M13 family metallopeptidase [Prevotella melaninogenica]MBW4760928.1 M13 family metallopeptidase [Prevotella melaninogenica]